MSLVLKILLLLAALCLAQVSNARPGGGHSSHSSHSSSHSSSHGSWSHSSSSSHSYSGGDNLGDFIESLIVLCIIIFVIYIISKANQQPKMLSSMPSTLNRSSEQLNIKKQLEWLKQSDPNFSSILFLDFATSLYHKFYTYANKPEFSYLRPFLATQLQILSSDLRNKQFSEIVINGIRWWDVDAANLQEDKITLEFDANYTAHTIDTRSRYTVSERWQFRRQSGVKSLPPDKMHSVCCPNCGAPSEFNDSGNCKHCNALIETGAFQWFLANRTVVSTTTMTTNDLVSYAQEQGTSLPTLFQVDFQEQSAAFAFRHDQLWEQFRQNFTDTIVKPYFLAIYRHWSERNWAGVRHLLADRLFESNQFWLKMYQEQSFTNRLDNLTIDNVQIVKIEIDRYYEAITTRIFAACLDYTLDANGKVIGGSQRSARRFSEYWTFVRYHHPDQTQTTESFNLTVCPQCGAPADNMGQAAICGYCGSKISTGEFSWVLYMITQDEAYAG